jgi:hypothetical protein
MTGATSPPEKIDWNAAARAIPEEWVKAAERGYSMHGAGLLRNILAAVEPHIRAAERERIAKLAEDYGAAYPVTRQDTYGGEYEAGVSFADLIREERADV